MRAFTTVWVKASIFGTRCPSQPGRQHLYGHYARPAQSYNWSALPDPPAPDVVVALLELVCQSLEGTVAQALCTQFVRSSLTLARFCEAAWPFEDWVVCADPVPCAPVATV